MRWDPLALVEQDNAKTGPAIERRSVVRVHDDLTFYEMRVQKILQRTGAGWSADPYRGCTHGCGYCLARRGHRYLGLNLAEDFENKIVVRVNAAERLARELRSPRWQGDMVTLGGNSDCYQRAEEVYALMPSIVGVLRELANPFRIATKSALVVRDLELLREAARVTDVAVEVSVGFVDERLRRLLEPGAPSPQKRLEACAALNEGGVPCGVSLAPIIPCLTDSADQLRATVRRAAEAGATSVTPIVLRLKPWFTDWLAIEQPALLPRYQQLYDRAGQVAPAYEERIRAQVDQFAQLYGIARRAASRQVVPRPRPAQLALL